MITHRIVSTNYDKIAQNEMVVNNQDQEMQNMSANYDDEYRKILNESKRQRKEPLGQPRKLKAFQSNANNSAQTVQDYLQKTRKRAEKYVPQRGGHVNSTMPVSSHTSKYGKVSSNL